MRYTVISASNDQIKKMIYTHLQKFISPFSIFSKKSLVSTIKSYKYSFDQEDNIGFVTLKTITGKTVEYQLRRGIPCFVEFTGFENIRYDVAYPKDELLDILTFWGKKAEENFWKGGQI